MVAAAVTAAVLSKRAEIGVGGVGAGTITKFQSSLKRADTRGVPCERHSCPARICNWGVGGRDLRAVNPITPPPKRVHSHKVTQPREQSHLICCTLQSVHLSVDISVYSLPE